MKIGRSTEERSDQAMFGLAGMWRLLMSVIESPMKLELNPLPLALVRALLAMSEFT